MYSSSNKERCEVIGKYMIEYHSTVRGAAAKFGISKSTVHKDVTNNLKKINPELYLRVKEILEVNKNERHLRGGEATKRKYMNTGKLKCKV